VTGTHSREAARERPPRAAVVGSLSVHGVVILFTLFVARPPQLPELQSIRVRLVAAAPEDAPIRADPAPPEVAEEEFRPPPPDPTPERAPQVETPKVVAETPPPVEREPEPEPARTEDVGEDPVNVQTEGASFSDPAYMNNIILQVQRYWRPPPGGRAYRAEISFVIHRDGSVTDIDWVRHSGSASFDLLCSSAIESAGRDRAFGPLPDSYPRDRLLVSFYFDPTVR
jgi:periplasmic protein TonB